jgi:hypothetical protein
MQADNENKSWREIFNAVANNQGELFAVKNKEYPGLHDRPISKPVGRLDATNCLGLGSLGINA